MKINCSFISQLYLFIALAEILDGVLVLALLGERLGRVAVLVLDLGVAAACRQEAATGARVGDRAVVDRVVVALVVDLEVSAIGRQEQQDLAESTNKHNK